MAQESIFAGIDVAKQRLDLALRPSGTVSVIRRDHWTSDRQGH